MVSTKLHRFLVLRANTGGVGIEPRRCSALKSVASNEMRVLSRSRRVAVAHEVNSIGPVWRIGGGKLIHIGKGSAGATAHDVIHQIVAQQPTGIGQTFGVLAG